MTFIDSNGVTVKALLEHGKIWIVDRLPETGTGALSLLKIEADEKDDVLRLITKWMQSIGVTIPQAREARYRAFADAVGYANPSVIVILDAHRLRPKIFEHLRLLAEEFAPLILVGCVLKIGAMAVDQESFMQRARFCVETVRLFD